MSKVSQILLTAWQSILKWVSGKNLFTFCLFLALAAIIWYGHALNTVRNRQMYVPIEWVNIPEDIAFEGSLPNRYTIIIRDQGKRLQSYREDGIVPIVIDLSSQLNRQDGEIRIPSEQLRQKVVDQLQGTAKLQSMQPDLIQLNYYRQASKKVAVAIDGNIQAAVQYQFTDLPSVVPSVVTIYGKRETLDTIGQVLTKHINLKDVKDSLHILTALQPMKDIRFSQDTVALYGYAENFTEKRFVLPIRVVGVPNGERVKVFPATAEVTLRISMKHYAEVNEDDIVLSCKYPKKEQVTLPIDVKYSTPFILQARTSPNEVEYIIER